MQYLSGIIEQLSCNGSTKLSCIICIYALNSSKMENSSEIPQIDFLNAAQKPFEFELISSDEALSGRGRSQHSAFRPHRIAFYAIMFIMRGRGRHFIDFKEYNFQKGSIIFISREQVHAFEKLSRMEAYILLFTEKFLERSSLGSNLMQQLSIYNYHLHQPVMHLRKEDYERFANLVLRIKQEYDRPEDFATEEIIQSALRIFLFEAERIRKTRLSAVPQPLYFEEFAHFQQLLQENVLSNRQVQHYAGELGFSTKKLNRITQEVVRLPAKTYINEKLALEIKRLLMNTNLSIKEIAYMTGFEAPTNFVKFFKKYAGNTPAEFRKSF